MSNNMPGTHPYPPSKSVWLSSVEHKRWYFEECWFSLTFNVWTKKTKKQVGTKTAWLSTILQNIFFYVPECIKYNGTQWKSKPFGYQHSLKYLLLCFTEQRKAYRFETWGRVNNDRMFIFEWIIPLSTENKSVNLGMLWVHLSAFYDTSAKGNSTCLFSEGSLQLGHLRLKFLHFLA